ncbi:sialate O-acetylesterase [Pedobacter sp. PAMC26386]|nr:sialate O-acetylesterase [Pedobacter sp. PAMC26386]
MKFKCSNLLYLSMILMGYTTQAKIVLPSVFSDNMVFQQKTNAAIWGKAEAGKQVEISTTWSTRKYTIKADQNGNWKVMVTTPVYGGPYQVSISDGEVLNLKNVLIGEVWICSGQSNMEMPLAGWGKVKDYEKEIAAARYPNIRLLQVPHQTSNTELNDVKVAHGGWRPCSPGTVAEFSSVAYFFAREIYQKKGIPIGLIHTSWGGTIAEAWMSAQALEQRPDFAAAVTAIKKDLKSGTADNPNRPTVLYNQMIHPFIPFAIRGAIWYQGESNAERAHQYRTLFPELIKDWRTQWNIGDFPFYFVQLAAYKKTAEQPQASDWAELRDAQLNTLSLQNTGMAVAIDLGEQDDIHPKNKQEVGRRLALIALAKNYGYKTTYSGPVLRAHQRNGHQISLTFKFADNGLKAAGGGALTGFAIAGKDQKFHWAQAVIKGNTIIVSSPEVQEPVEVRYGWANYPLCNLYNGAGLPASPFRTDQWKDNTSENK